MKQARRASFTEILQAAAPSNAVALFEKARLASAVAKIALRPHDRKLAYQIKGRHIDRMLQVLPRKNEIRRYKDFDCNRWVVQLRGHGALHWRRLDEALCS